MEGMVQISAMQKNDWKSVKDIYREGIETGIATFETTVPSWEEWNRNHLEDCRFVARMDSQVTGWAALSPVSNRCVYQGVAEISIYVSKEVRGRGVGTRLLRRLIEASEKTGIWTLQAGIFSENEPSIKLHKKCGFRVVGRRERIGKLDGDWKDIILMERRSVSIGS